MNSRLLDAVCGFALRFGMTVWLTLAISLPQASAYQRYNDGCHDCHGGFLSGVSPKGTVFPGNDKHGMHRNPGNMGTACNLCHTDGDGRNPFIGSSEGTANNVGVGCSGCHGREQDAGNDSGLSSGRGAGLRQHHYNSGVTTCASASCHTDGDPANYTPIGENVKPQYYDTVDTLATMPCNPDATGNTNENWTIGDFAGLDNDGDLLYDLAADPNCAVGPVDLTGIVQTADDLEICAMVLASGKFMFSCNPIGVFSLTGLPRENDGTVKRQIYADGFFPRIDILLGSTDETVVMTRSGLCPSYNLPYSPDVFSESAGKRIDISGVVLQQDSQTPICAMVLANGQHMFSCDGSGSYSLNIPLDSNGQFKLQVYADGFAPTIQIFDEFSAVNTVRMARASECQ